MLAIVEFLKAVAPQFARARSIVAEDESKINEEHLLMYRRVLAVQMLSNASARDAVIQTLADGLRDAASSPEALLQVISATEQQLEGFEMFSDAVDNFILHTSAYNDLDVKWTDSERQLVAPIMFATYEAAVATHGDLQTFEQQLQSLVEEIHTVFAGESPEKNEVLTRVHVLKNIVSELGAASKELTSSSAGIDEVQSRHPAAKESEDRVSD